MLNPVPRICQMTWETYPWRLRIKDWTTRGMWATCSELISRSLKVLFQLWYNELVVKAFLRHDSDVELWFATFKVVSHLSLYQCLVISPVLRFPSTLVKFGGGIPRTSWRKTIIQASIATGQVTGSLWTTFAK